MYQNVEISGEQAAKLAQDASFRLDSAPGTGGPWSRWSYRLFDPILLLTCDSVSGISTLQAAGDPKTTGSNGIRCPHPVIRKWPSPLEALAWMARSLKPFEQGPGTAPFSGGWFGHVSYDLGRWFENLPVTATDDLRWPLFEFTFHDRVLAQDGQTGKHYLVSCSHPFEPRPMCLKPGASKSNVDLRRASKLISSFTRAQYEQAVRRVIEYIREGDVFQVNLSQRYTAPAPCSAEHIYSRLTSDFPAFYGAFQYCGDRALICNSPELFLKVSKPSAGGRRRVTTRPIKGTRARQTGLDELLRDSIKDQAELNMIVDLERNDLGRICEVGSIRVTEPRTIESHPTVYHGVATIEGELRENISFVDLLRATFPGGSVTGAPKIRAMQIIEALEPVRRGPYCGAIGYLSAGGEIQFNIAIRTIYINQAMAHISVGGGIVADSDPAAEFEETQVKAGAMFAAMGIGLR